MCWSWHAPLRIFTLRFLYFENVTAFIVGGKMSFLTARIYPSPPILTNLKWRLLRNLQEHWHCWIHKYLLYNRWISELASVALSLATQLELFIGSFIFWPDIPSCVRSSPSRSRRHFVLSFMFFTFSLPCDILLYICHFVSNHTGLWGEEFLELRSPESRSWRYAFDIQKQYLLQYSQQFCDWFW